MCSIIRVLRLTVALLLAVLSWQPLAATDDAVSRWAAAIGGREKVAAIACIYREATIDVHGFSGTIHAWHTRDGRYRKEERVADFASIETFDGTTATVQQGDTPPRQLAGPDLERARSMPFANWAAVFFAFFPARHPGGTLTIEDDGTIVLKPRAGIDWHVTLDPSTSLPAVMRHREGDHEITVRFVAYETIDGITFEKEIHRSTGDPSWDAVIRFTTTILNPSVDSSLFVNSR